MKRRTMAVRAGKTALHLLLLLLSAALLLLFVSAFLHFTVLDRDFYVRAVATDTYAERIRETILEGFEVNCARYRIPYETLAGAVDGETVGALCREYLGNVYDALLSGGEVTPVVYPREPLAQTVYGYRAVQEDPIDDAEAVIEELDALASGSVAALSGHALVGLLSELVYRNPLLVRAADALRFAPPVAALLLAAVLLLPTDTLRRRLYGAAGAFWFSACACFVPFLCLKLYDLPARLILDESKLRHLVRAANDAFVGCGFAVSLLALLAASALLALSVVLLLRPGKSRGAGEGEGRG